MRINLLRSIYYFVKNIWLNSNSRKIRVALSCKVKPGTEFGGYNKVGENTFLSGKIGRYTYIAGNCRLNAEIGKFCSISPNVKIIEATHPLNMISTSPVFYSTKSQCGFSFVDKDKYNELIYVDDNNGIASKIGNDVWIGENVIIKGGVTIGDGAVIAMGAVVVKDVPPYSIFGGIPAKEIKKRFSQQEIDQLLMIKWWDKPIEWLNSNKEFFISPPSFFRHMEEI